MRRRRDRRGRASAMAVPSNSNTITMAIIAEYGIQPFALRRDGGGDAGPDSCYLTTGLVLPNSPFKFEKDAVDFIVLSALTHTQANGIEFLLSLRHSLCHYGRQISMADIEGGKAILHVIDG